MKDLNTTLKKLHTFLEPELISLKNTIIQLLKCDVDIINEMYSFLSSHPGKLLRPLLTILSSKLLDYTGKNHIYLAAAIECIHMATLLHDDVIDNSKIRHSNPTVNLLWSNKSAILMGDYLFSKAFQSMVLTSRIDILQILSTSSTIISRGEFKQLENIGNINLSFQEYYNIINDKTACLFQAATHVGAIITTANEKTINTLKEVGLNFGLAYQILDDINDYSLKKSTIGKNPCDDIKESKITLPLIIALEKMNKKEKVYIKQIIDKPNKTKKDITIVLNLINQYNALEKSKTIAKKHLNNAIELINTLNKNEAQENFLELLMSIA